MKLTEDKLQELLGKGTFDDKHENLFVDCIWCGGKEFGISLKENHVFNCFRKAKCGITGNVFTLLKKLERFDLLSNNGTESIRYSDKLINIIEQKVIENKFDLTIPTIQLPLGFKRIYSNFYLENRDFDSFHKYEVGTTKLFRKLRDHVIIVIREQGEIKGYIARLALNSKQHKELEQKLERRIPRYRNSESDFGKILVGYDEIKEDTETVILVEGLFGKEHVERILGIDGADCGIKCCSTSGAKISEEQIFKLQLKGIKKITLFFDIDVINKIKKIALKLMNEFDEVKIVVSTFKDERGNDKDPADLTEEEMFEVFKNEKDPIEFYLNKVHIMKLK